ncbi:MAG: hypothetical protein NTY45_08145 [Elusimicrobia bacterium]|nr:hypothetical protein [Elusimicrobiota bacterium]
MHNSNLRAVILIALAGNAYGTGFGELRDRVPAGGSRVFSAAAPVPAGMATAEENAKKAPPSAMSSPSGRRTLRMTSRAGRSK